MAIHAVSGSAAHQLQPQQVTAAALKAANNDGDGRTGVAALNDGDAAAQAAARSAGRVNVRA
ncbi:MAG TPA: hypothetical protein VKV27_01775 [Solirubrobacteraceae bacterium]|nr:hypothetical protein [Solirubrobacteraceae bacterium]